MLLEGASREDLYLISEDKAYRSPVDENSPAQFLLREWSDKKKNQLFFYPRLSEFFREKYPKVRLASDLERRLEIARLVGSPDFNTTHLSIAKLSRYQVNEFSDDEVKEVVEAGITNNQIYWIAEDPDVRDFFTTVVSARKAAIAPNNLEVVQELFKLARQAEEEEEDEIPF